RLIGAERQPTSDCRQSLQQSPSTVWDDPFATDDAAWAAFRRTVEEEGMRAFLDQAVVIPFRR
ncbi:hypothetical protein ACFFIQ_21440, partial [Sphingobium indicum]